MRNLIVLTIGALLLASCGGGVTTPPIEQPGTNPPIETPPSTEPPVDNPPTSPTTSKPLFVPVVGAAVGSGDGTKEGTVYVTPTAGEIDLINLINEVRTKGTVNGVDATAGSCVAGKFTPLKALTFNGLYSFAARKHAEYLTTVAYEGHYENQPSSSAFYGRTVNERIVRTYKEKAGLEKYYSGDNTTIYGGELVAGNSDDAARAVKAWMLSSGHCNAIMKESSIDIGSAHSINDAVWQPGEARAEIGWVIIISSQ